MGTQEARGNNWGADELLGLRSDTRHRLVEDCQPWACCLALSPPANVFNKFWRVIADESDRQALNRDMNDAMGRNRGHLPKLVNPIFVDPERRKP